MSLKAKYNTQHNDTSYSNMMIIDWNDPTSCEQYWIDTWAKFNHELRSKLVNTGNAMSNLDQSR